jgi:hypothetical protein
LKPRLLVRVLSVAALVALAVPALAAAAARSPVHTVEVVDSVTGRGVPLVELTTVSGVRFVTDSAGLVALNEPELMGREVWLEVRSHGYRYPIETYGFRGVLLKPVPGGTTRLHVERLQVAERLYRVTGEGIYRDSVLAGRRVPLRQPLLNAQVTGQDSIQAAPYRGRLFWVWGDTNRQSHPLGNFAVSAATSALPGRGGLAPSVGIDLDYFTAPSGFSRRMCPMPGNLVVWLDGLAAVRDREGRERLLARYMRPRALEDDCEKGLVAFDDRLETFLPLRRFRGRTSLFTKNYSLSHAFRAEAGGKRYLYFAMPFPAVRVLDTWEDATEPSHYEAYTCLVQGARYEGAATRLDRDPSGRLRYGWKRDTSPVGRVELEELVAAGRIRPAEACWQLRDVETEKPFKGHSGSVHWNAHRGRWVMIVEEAGGTSPLGELWFCEADTPTGPWVYARKIVTHDRYSFYNPAHHPFFDEEGGRRIYFEGTYVNTFSGNTDRTPRYDYNQVMYRLELDDPRLELPAPVYAVAGGTDLLGAKVVDWRDESTGDASLSSSLQPRASSLRAGEARAGRLMMAPEVEAARAWSRVARIAFFARPRDWRAAGGSPGAAVRRWPSPLEVLPLDAARPCPEEAP